MLICVGIACNEWALAKLYSADGILEIATKIKIWLFDIVLIIAGLLLVKYRNVINL